MSTRDSSLGRLAVRILALIVVCLAVLFATELTIDLARSRVPWSELTPSARMGQSLASTVSRAFNNLTAMVLTFIALAVPITANMYTPKLVEIFVRDKVNIAAMVFFAGMGAHAVFGQSVMYDQWTPLAIYTTLWVSGVVGFAVLIPYYLYVLSFLNPVTIIRRVTGVIFAEFDEAVRGARPAAETRRRIDQEILNLGNVILRATDRADRDVALDAIDGLQSAVMRYGEVKARIAPDFFEVEASLFTGHSRDAIRFITADRVWVEHKCLHQLQLAYSASLAKMPDAISAISGVNRRIAQFAQRTGDAGLLRLCVRYFNTFLREAVKRKDAHAIYDVCSQYTFLAKELLATSPGAAVAIGRHFKYYAEFARWQGMQFIYEVMAHDLMGIVGAAYEGKCARRAELLAVFLEFAPAESSARLTKSRIELAAFFTVHAFEAEASLVLELVSNASPQHLDEARRTMLGTDDPVFWEVTDAQRNLDYVEPELRSAVEQVLDRVSARN